MIDYKHQCRYCAHCVFTMNETFWCEELDKDCANAKRPNTCASFLFNECAADATDWSVTYKPRKRSPYKQEWLFERKTDKQKEKECKQSNR